MLGLFHIYHYGTDQDESGNPIGELFIPLIYEVRRVDHGNGTYTDHFILLEDEWKKAGNPKLSYSKTTYKGLFPMAFTLELEVYRGERQVFSRGFYAGHLEYTVSELAPAYDSLIAGGTAALSVKGWRRRLGFYCPESGPCEKSSGREVSEVDQPIDGDFEMRVVGELDTGGSRLLVIRVDDGGLHCYDPDRQLIVGQSFPDVHITASGFITYLKAEFQANEIVRSACLRTNGQPIP